MQRECCKNFGDAEKVKLCDARCVLILVRSVMQQESVMGWCKPQSPLGGFAPGAPLRPVLLCPRASRCPPRPQTAKRRFWRASRCKDFSTRDRI
jgi:hypothetical protein